MPPVSAQVTMAVRAARQTRSHLEAARKVAGDEGPRLEQLAASLEAGESAGTLRELRAAIDTTLAELNALLEILVTVKPTPKSRARITQALVTLHPASKALEKFSDASLAAATPVKAAKSGTNADPPTIPVSAKVAPIKPPAPPPAPAAAKPPPAPPAPPPEPKVFSAPAADSPESYRPRTKPSIVPPDMADRRQQVRVEIETDIGFASDTNFYTGFSGDISEGGLFVATYKLLDLGTELALSFVLPNNYQINATAKVAWVRQTTDPDSETMPGMGVQFDELPADDRVQIEEFVRLRQPLFYDDFE